MITLIYFVLSTRQAESAAASIAALLGGVPPAEVLRRARQSCRAIQPQFLSAEAFESSAPDLELYGRSTWAALGDIDAFV